MIGRILKWLVLVPVALLALVLAVANRAPVTVSLDPFAGEPSVLNFTVPLFVFAFMAVILGVVIGGSMTWWRQGAYRKRARRAEADLAAAQVEIARLRADLSRLGGPPAEPQGTSLSFLGRPAA